MASLIAAKAKDCQTDIIYNEWGKEGIRLPKPTNILTQILLKFVLANPAVTCVIAGTGKPEHMKDNAQAGLGVYPDAAMLKLMVADVGV